MKVIVAQYYDTPVFSEEPLTGEVKPYPVMDEAMKAAIKEYEIPNGYALMRAAIDEGIRIRAEEAKAQAVMHSYLKPECRCAFCEYDRLKAAKAPPPYIQAMNGQDDPEDALQRILDKVKWMCK